MTARKIFETKLPNGKTAQLFGRGAGDPEIYADGAWGLTYSAGLCKLNLFTVVPEEDEKLERREVAVRLTMSITALMALRDFLVDKIQVLEAQNLFEVSSVDQPSEKKKSAKKVKKKSAK